MSKGRPPEKRYFQYRVDIWTQYSIDIWTWGVFGVFNLKDLVDFCKKLITSEKTG